MFTSNGKREFEPCDQGSALLVVYCSLFLHINLFSSSWNFSSIRIALSRFYLLIIDFETLST